MLENTDFAGNNQKDKVLLVCRTSAKKILVKPRTKIGEVSAPIPIGAHESSAIFKPTVAIAGRDGAIFRVPWARLDSCFFFQRTDGNSLYLGDGEKEVGGDLSGLPMFYIGNVGSTNNIDFAKDIFGNTGKTYFEAANEALQNYKPKTHN